MTKLTSTTNIVINIMFILIVCAIFLYLSLDVLKKFKKVNKIEFNFKVISKRINLIYVSFIIVPIIVILLLISIIIINQTNSKIVSYMYDTLYVLIFVFIFAVICLLQLNQKGLIVAIDENTIHFLDQNIKFEQIKRICYNKSHRFIYFFDNDGRFIRIRYNILIREELENNSFVLDLVN